MKPYYWPIDFEDPIVLYTGAVRAMFGTAAVEGIGQVTMQWRPTIDVRWQMEGPLTIAAGMEAFQAGSSCDQPVLLDLIGELTPQGQDPWAPSAGGTTLVKGGPAIYRSSGYFRGLVGKPTGLHRVVLNLVNYIDHPGVTDMQFDTEGWRIVVSRPSVAREQLTQLKRLGGFAFTDLVTIERTDECPFDYSDTEPLQAGLSHLLTFAKGAHVGVALPVGFDADGKAVCSDWRVSSVDRWTVPLAWADKFHLDVLPSLYEAWRRWQSDPFWAEVLGRSVRATVAANAPDPVEEAVTTAASGLELLAWAVLVVQEGWLRPGDGELSSAARMRLLLKWAHVESDLPPQLTELAGLSAAFSGVNDGPTAITWVRNRIVHPPKQRGNGPPDWPSHELLIQTWRLAVEYLHLVILRLLGHEGEYASRLHIDGRPAGAMTKVPWEVPYRP